MIKIEIATDGENVADSIEEKDATMSEVGVVLLRLEQMKKSLMEKEFKGGFVVKEGSFAEEEEDDE